MNGMIGNLYQFGLKTIQAFWRDDKGIGTLEIVLIAAVLIMVAIFFKDWIMDFLGNLMNSVEGKAETVFE
jgi:Flp pilus assembly pilin Flp